MNTANYHTLPLPFQHDVAPLECFSATSFATSSRLKAVLQTVRSSGFIRCAMPTDVDLQFTVQIARCKTQTIGKRWTRPWQRQSVWRTTTYSASFRLKAVLQTVRSPGFIRCAMPTDVDLQFTVQIARCKTQTIGKRWTRPWQRQSVWRTTTYSASFRLKAVLQTVRSPGFKLLLRSLPKTFELKLAV